MANKSWTHFAGEFPHMVSLRTASDLRSESPSNRVVVRMKNKNNWTNFSWEIHNFKDFVSFQLKNKNKELSISLNTLQMISSSANFLTFLSFSQRKSIIPLTNYGDWYNNELRLSLPLRREKLEWKQGFTIHELTDSKFFLVSSFYILRLMPVRFFL